MARPVTLGDLVCNATYSPLPGKLHVNNKTINRIGDFGVFPAVRTGP